MVTTVVYSIFITNSNGVLDKLKSVLKSPLIIALIIGGILNLSGSRLPKGIEITIQNIASITRITIILNFNFENLGFKLSPEKKKPV